MLAVGAEAPAFTGVTQSGRSFSLASLRGTPVVLYFYPKANTMGCTVETKGFAEHYAEIRNAGFEVVGVSVDSIDTQRGFAEKCGAAFPLIADRDKSIARQYGVLGLLGIAKRVTFFLGPDGRIADIVEGMLPGPHLQRTLQRVRAATTGSASSSSR
jgi:thioredoxin-dependent peroxiredoxin